MAVEILTPDQASEGFLLSSEAGWNQTQDDWRLMIGAGTAFGLRDNNGRLVATALALPHGAQFAWISMVLVTAAFQRRGIASGLLALCIDDIEKRGLVAGLDATPSGRQVYLPLGFEDVYGLQRLHGTDLHAGEVVKTPDGMTISPLNAEDTDALVAFDVPRFGGERRAILAHLTSRQPGNSWIAKVDATNEVAGYALGRDGRECRQIGPLVARSEDLAIALASRAVQALAGPVYIDVADRHQSLNAWLAARGFAPQRPFYRMYKGRTQPFDDPACIFAIAGPELG
jgi:GNAT superfamily N-acetyltransferase